MCLATAGNLIVTKQRSPTLPCRKFYFQRKIFFIWFMLYLFLLIRIFPYSRTSTMKVFGGFWIPSSKYQRPMNSQGLFYCHSLTSLSQSTCAKMLSRALTFSHKWTGSPRSNIITTQKRQVDAIPGFGWLMRVQET